MKHVDIDYFDQDHYVKNNVIKQKPMKDIVIHNKEHHIDDRILKSISKKK